MIDQTPVAAQEIILAGLEVVKNSKGMAAVGIVSAIVAILVQISKATFLQSVWSKWGTSYQHLVVVALSVLSQTLISLTTGLGWIDAVIASMATAGGAIAIYEAVTGVIRGKNVS